MSPPSSECLVSFLCYCTDCLIGPFGTSVPLSSVLLPCPVPVTVDEGVEGQSVIPAAGEVHHVDLTREILEVKGQKPPKPLSISICVHFIKDLVSLSNWPVVLTRPQTPPDPVTAPLPSPGSSPSLPQGTAVCSDEPNSAGSSHCWSAVGLPSHPSSHPLPAHTHTHTVHSVNVKVHLVFLSRLHTAGKTQ